MRWPSGGQGRVSGPRIDTLGGRASRCRRSSSTRSSTSAASGGEERAQVRVLGRLHEAQMPAGQGQRRVARDHAQHRRRDVLEAGAAQQLGVRRAGDAVEDDADHLDVLAVAAEAVDQGRDRGAHAGDVDHEQHRQAEQGGDVGRGAGAVGGAVEQAHDAFAEQQVAAAAALLEQPGQGLEAHRPGVDVVGRAAGGGVMEGRIDVVGADLERADRQRRAGAAPPAGPASAWSCRSPDAGAATIRPDALMTLPPPAGGGRVGP